MSVTVTPVQGHFQLKLDRFSKRLSVMCIDEEFGELLTRGYAGVNNPSIILECTVSDPDHAHPPKDQSTIRCGFEARVVDTDGNGSVTQIFGQASDLGYFSPWKRIIRNSGGIFTKNPLGIWVGHFADN